MSLRIEQKINRPIMVVFVVVVIVFIGYFVWEEGLKNVSISPSLSRQASQNIVIKDLDVSLIQRSELYEFISTNQQEPVSQTSGKASDQTIPTEPSNPRAYDGLSGKTIHVFWDPPLLGKPITYRIYRSTERGMIGERIAEVSPPLVFHDRSVNNLTPYYYTVHSVNAQNKESTNEIQIMGISTDAIPPASPSGVSVSDIGSGGTLLLKWTPPPDKDLKGVNIYRSEVNGLLGAFIAFAVPTETSTEDRGLMNGKEYFYALTSIDESGNESSKELARPVSGRTNPFSPLP